MAARKARDVWFPNTYVAAFQSTKTNLPNNVLPLKVPKTITKPELAVYLESVYGMNVQKVNTLNRYKRAKRAPRFGRYKPSDMKIAYVTIDGEAVMPTPSYEGEDDDGYLANQGPKQTAT